MTRRLLILSASAGSGHNRAAEALHEAARGFAAVESAWRDALEATPRFFARIYAQSYIWAAAYAPELYGYFYRLGFRRSGHKRLERLIDRFDRLAYRKLAAEVRAFAPDACIATHFLPAHVLLAKAFDVPVFVAVTDFCAHPFWADPRAAGYFAACDEVRAELAAWGVPEEKVEVTGIPIHPSFSAPLPGRPPPAGGRLRLLFMSGGFAFGRVEEAVERLLALERPCELTVVTGRNEELRARLEKRAGGRARVLGFVTDVASLMDASDLMITKAGGLTTSECLARGLPMVIYEPIPGQEEANADYLAEEGAALKVRWLDLLAYKVGRLLEEPERLERMREAAHRLGRPGAARAVVERVLQALDGS